MKDEAAAHVASDAKEKERADTLNKADQMVFQTRKQIEEFGDKIPADKKAALESAVARLEDAHKAQDVDACNAAIKEIETLFGQVQQDIYNAQAQAQQQAQNPGAGANPNSGSSHQSGPEDVDFEEVK